MLFAISIQFQSYLTPVDLFNIKIDYTVSPFFSHAMSVCIEKETKQKPLEYLKSQL